MRLIRSKIRKREDSPVNVESPLPHRHHHHQQQQQHHNNNHQIATVKTISNGGGGAGDVALQNINNNNVASKPVNNGELQSPWVFPPLPPSPNIYGFNHLSLMQANQDKNGFKGLKRQLSGRFKRMISRKPSEPPTPTIPPELKPQLKTIYVY